MPPSEELVIQPNTDDPHDPATVDTGTLSEIKLDNFNAFNDARKESGKSEQVKSETKTGKESVQKTEEPTTEDETGETEGDKGNKTDGNKVEIETELSPEDLDKTQTDVNKAKQKPVVPRDYSIFDPADVDDFKKMGNKAFDKVKKIYQENKELKARLPIENKTGLPDNYYSHPDAYLLSPDYKEVSSNVNLAQQIQAHWEEQEFNLKTNGKVKDLGYNKELGELVPGEDRDATDKDASAIGRLIMKSRQNTMDALTKLNTIITSFKGKHENAVRVIKEAESKAFAGFDAEDHPTQPLQKDIINTIPAELRSSPLAPLVAKSGAYIALLLNANKHLEKELATAKSLKRDISQSSPKKGSFVAGGKNVPVIDMTLFKTARAEG